MLKTEIELCIAEIQRKTKECYKEQTDKLNKVSIIKKKNDPDVRVYNPINKTQTASKHLEKFRNE